MEGKEVNRTSENTQTAQINDVRTSYCEDALSSRFKQHIVLLNTIRKDLLQLQIHTNIRKFFVLKHELMNAVNSMFIFKDVPHERIFKTIIKYNGCVDQLNLLNKIHSAKEPKELIEVVEKAKELLCAFRSELSKEIKQVCPMLKNQIPYVYCYCPYSKIEHATSKKRCRLVPYRTKMENVSNIENV